MSYRIEEAAYAVNTIPLATIINRRFGVVSSGSTSFVSTTVLSKNGATLTSRIVLIFITIQGNAVTFIFQDSAR